MKKILTLFAILMMAVTTALADGYEGPLKVSIDAEGSEIYVDFPMGIKLKDNMTETPYIIAGGNKIDAEAYYIEDDIVNYYIGISFDDDLAEGDYTLVLPAGMFSVIGGADNGEWSYAFTVGEPSVTLNDAGFATFSYVKGAVIKTAGVTAYTAVVDGEDIVLTELDGNIPAYTGVILYGTPGTKVELDPTWYDFANVTENDLKPTVFEGYILAPFEANAWALGTANKFLTYTGTAFTPNRAYIASAGASGAKRIVFAGEETTAINNAISNAAVREGKFVEGGKIVIIKNGAKYNVAGQEVK